MPSHHAPSDAPGSILVELLDRDLPVRDLPFSDLPDSGCPADLWGLAARARAERRVLDAETEFDAALAAGEPMPGLVARDHELRLATAACDALLATSGCRSTAGL